MAQRGLIETARVAGGYRVIALPGLGWETAPGDPAGPEQLPEPIPAPDPPDLTAVA